MKLKHLFYVQALVVLNALVFLITPNALLSRIGVTPDDELTLAFRNTGGLLLLLALVAWFAARAEDGPLRRNVRLSFLIGHSVLFAVYAITMLTGGPTFGPVIWVHLAFAIAFAYFQFIRPDA